MKCVLRIGYVEILLPDHKGVEKVVETLSRGMLCRGGSYRYRGEPIEIEDEAEVSLTMLPPSTQFKVSAEMEEKFAERIQPQGRPRRKAVPSRELKLLK
jgi:hypothetical protein